jgi:hypothetical protein
VTRVLYISISNTPPHFHAAKLNGSGEGQKPKNKRERRKELHAREKDQNTKGTRCSSTKMGHVAKNGRLEEVKLDQETSLPIQPDSLTVVQLTGQKVEPSVLD